MADDFSAILVELKRPVWAKDEEPNPVSQFERFLADQQKPFVVEEYVVKKEDLFSDPDWVAWFAEQSTESEAFVAVFLVRQEDKGYFDSLWAQWLTQKEETGNGV